MLMIPKLEQSALSEYFETILTSIISITSLQILAKKLPIALRCGLFISNNVSSFEHDS